MNWLFVLLLTAHSGGCIKVFNVKDYGAKGDGVTDDTTAVRATTKAVAQNGGGQLLFPSPGTWLTAPFNITSNTQLYVAAGATLLALSDPSKWPVIPPLPSYGVSRDNQSPYRYQSFVYALNQTQVEITGGGTIDGNGAYWWKNRPRKPQPGRGRLVELQGCTNVAVHDLNLKNSPFWTLHPVYCHNVHFYNLNITAPSDSPNTDATDPDSSTNVLIEHNYFSTGDDHVAIKSGINQAGRAVNLPIRNLTVRYNVCGNGHGISIGSETSGGIYDVYVHDNKMLEGAKHGLQIKTAPARGGAIENIYWANNDVSKVKGPAMFITMNYDSSPPAPKLPVIKNVTYTGITGSGDKNAGEFDCLKDSPCSELFFSNIDMLKYHGAWKCQNVHLPFSVQNVKPDGLTQCLQNS